MNNTLGYESHAGTTILSPGSEHGWRKINDFLEIKMTYQGHTGPKTIPYGWQYTGNQLRCNSFGTGSAQNFADIINKTAVQLRLTKTLVTGSVDIPHTVLYRQHWGVINSASPDDLISNSKFLYELVLSGATINFPVTCKVESINLDVDFGEIQRHEIDSKQILKNIRFSCDRDSQIRLQVQSVIKPHGLTDVKYVSFGSSSVNLDINADFNGMTNDGKGNLEPAVSVKKDTQVNIPVKFTLKKNGDISTGSFYANGYIVLYQP
ncbi:hypothetical protein O4O00_21950 [Citrobacter sedlakii]|uniref:MrpH family fimbial adhesin n=1 Tax=Citrobacter sedlakii TaxID=67826 RepID=UPI0022B32FB0|nr:hypothetical protein [Citrobacter sedlakii]MCZ4677020.1 hypothetical protein [Citrobacter sedlakii]MDR5007077.1 hypothetical protein [Citrobacter sedlakii]